jgi:hypothetical protein
MGLVWRHQDGMQSAGRFIVCSVILKDFLMLWVAPKLDLIKFPEPVLLF